MSTSNGTLAACEVLAISHRIVGVRHFGDGLQPIGRLSRRALRLEVPLVPPAFSLW